MSNLEKTQVFPFPVKFMGPALLGAVIAGLTAGATQTQAGATQLGYGLNYVATCATAGDGVALPKWVAGAKVEVVNNGATNLSVYPYNETTDVDTIDGGAAAAVGVRTIPPLARFEYFADPVTPYNWLVQIISMPRKRVIDLTALATLDAKLSGSIITLGTAGGFTVTLPAPFVGGEFRFVAKVAPTTAYILSTAASGNVVQGVVLTTDVNSATDPTNTAASDTITFAANKARIGDYVDIWSDGTYWYASAVSILFDGITFTQAT
jgi:hypothetical protein